MTLKKLKEKTSMNRDIKSTKMEIADIYCRDIQKKLKILIILYATELKYYAHFITKKKDIN